MPERMILYVRGLIAPFRKEPLSQLVCMGHEKDRVLIICLKMKDLFLQ